MYSLISISRNKKQLCHSYATATRRRQQHWRLSAAATAAAAAAAAAAADDVHAVENFWHLHVRRVFLLACPTCAPTST
jgi:hypothetical protein